MRAIGNITTSIAVAAVAILSVSTYSPEQLGSSPQSSVSLERPVAATPRPSARPSNDDLWVQLAIAAIGLGSFAIGSARERQSSDLGCQ